MRQGTLTASRPASRPYRDFLAALGLSRRGRTAGIVVQGSIDWTSGGVAEVGTTQQGLCSDSKPLEGGSIVALPFG